MRPWLALTAVLVGLLGLAAPAAANTAGTATITLADAPTNKYLLTVQNTGTDSLKCLQFTLAPGMTLVPNDPPGTSLSGPGTVVASAPDAFTATGFSVPTDNVVAIIFITTAPYTPDGGGTLMVGSGCGAGPDTAVPVAGPSSGIVQQQPPGGPIAAPPPDTGGDGTGNGTGTGTGSTSAVKSTPCECADVKGAYAGVTRKGRVVTLSVKWTMKCTAGGGGCTGRIDAVPSPAATTDVLTGSKKQRFARSRSAVIRCSSSKCKNRTVTSRLRFTLSKTASNRLRDGRTLKVRLRAFCLGGSAQRQTKLMSLALVFGNKGRFDKSRSDLK